MHGAPIQAGQFANKGAEALRLAVDAFKLFLAALAVEVVEQIFQCMHVCGCQGLIEAEFADGGMFVLGIEERGAFLAVLRDIDAGG